MSEVSAESSGRRKKRRRNKNAAKGWASPALGTSLFWTMVLTAGAAGAIVSANMWTAANMAGVLMAGMPEHEVRYLRGEPKSRSADGLAWTYTEGDSAESVVQFGTDRRIVTINCKPTISAALGCPESFGVTIGTSEDWLINRLGPPSRSSYIPNGKLLIYDDLGLVYTMREYRVAAITKQARGNNVGLIGRVLWNLMP